MAWSVKLITICVLFSIAIICVYVIITMITDKYDRLEFRMSDHSTTEPWVRHANLAGTQLCTLKKRRELIREACRRNPPPLYNTGYTNKHGGNYSVPTPTLLAFDAKQHTLGCMISKVASTSWLAYINRLNPQDPKVDRVPAISASTVNEKYANWTKYIIVKHPLQRLVSAYYEAVVKRHSLGNEEISFHDFLVKLTTENILYKDEHWAPYSSNCHPCLIDYEYILRVESMDDDLPLFNSAVGYPRNATLVTLNRNCHFDKQVLKEHQCNRNEPNKLGPKYDQFLGDFNQQYPELFSKVQDIYRLDMEMFRYTWDTINNSTCRYQVDYGACC